MPKDLFKFNPSLTPPEILLKTFIGRERELRRILSKLEECAGGASLRHFLLIGPRGIGKTHFILLIYYILKGVLELDGKFRELKDAWIPVRFAEEEYGISMLGEFLLRVLQELKESSPGIKEFDLTEFKAPRPLHRAEVDRLLGLLLRYRERWRRRFLLLVDNFHEILERFGEEDQGRLRDILMSKDLFLVIGTAPTLFEEVVSYEKPFYNFFENIWLEELKTGEGIELIRRWWELDGKTENLKRLEDYRPKLNALMHLTGGNPRLLLSLYSIITEANIVEVEEAFKELLDELTPYFQSLMKDFSPQQKKILDAMALMQGPSSPTEIAREANIEVDAVTSQLKRLERAGYVKPLKEKGKKEVLYDFKERLFRLWRQMRVEASRERLSFIVTIIKIWYTEEELREQFKRISSKLFFALEEAKGEEIEHAIKSLSYLQEAAPPDLYPSIASARLFALTASGRFEEAEEELQRLFDEAQERQDEELLAQAYYQKAFYHHSRGEEKESIEPLKEYLKLRPNNPFAWVPLGIAYLEVEEYQEAVKAFLEAVKLNPDLDGAWYSLGVAYHKLGDYQEAIKAYEKATQTKPGEWEYWHSLGVSFLSAHDFEEAVGAFRRGLELNPEAPELWDGLGYAYLELKHYQEAAEACTEAIRLSPHPRFYLRRSLAFWGWGKITKAIKDAEKAFELAGRQADETGEEEMVNLRNGAAELLVTLNLLRSKRSISRGKAELGERHFREGLPYIQYLSSEELREILTSYLITLLKKKQLDSLKKAIKALEEKALPELKELLRFYRIAVDFLETGNRRLLNRLFPELRELVESLANM